MPEIEIAIGSTGVIAALVLIGILTFAECAFLFGLFVPGGDVLLLAAGVFAAQGDLPLAGVLLVVFVTAVAGYEVGYYIGQKTGPRIFKRKSGIFFRKEHADRAKQFYERHGAKTIVIARFIGYVRTVAPLLAGIGQMQRRKFVFYNISGALAWSLSFVLLGYWLGSALTEEVKRYIVPATLIAILLIFTTSTIYWLKLKHAK